MHELAIGIDIGGTRTKSGLINLHTGQMIYTIIHPTEKKSENAFLKQVISAICQLTSIAERLDQPIIGIGFGVTGFVDENGVVDSTYGFLEFMENYPLCGIIEAEFHLPCRVDNDARVVALGEALYGAGKGFGRVLVLTLGTGLGFGFVINRSFCDILPFSHMGGHLSITDKGGICYCGKTGCLEALVSSTGIINAANDLHWGKKFPHIPINAESIFAEARKGLADAQQIVDQLINYLRTGIHNYINLFAPNMIVLGGGISKGLGDYLDTLIHSEYLLPYTGYSVKISISVLEEQAGMLGSAALFQTRTVGQQ